MSDKRKRIVIKFGTGILTKSSGNALNPRQLRRLTGEVADVVRAGHQCLLVSSGAVGAGLRLMGLSERPNDLPSIQACAAIGQSRLMQLYETLFQRHGFHVAQLLLSHQDIDSRTRYQNARNTLERLLRFRNVVPIINENDSVAVEELRLGDNDRLSAEVAILAQADLLLILTSVEGLLDEKNRLVAKVTDIDAVAHLASETIGIYSRGGMVTKLQAAKLAFQAGIPSVIGSGFEPGIISAAVAGKAVGTQVLANT
ncbi:MAG: glutamate 5-kinase [Verrucomicrobia bacterium]|nr:glutamate 5-kinase [Verrucomicrobiota bacterium]MBV9300185.1 glutamate 5-kinase [Verrucomicrobiota bacterium]